MASRIPNEFIDDVLSRTNIVEVIGQHLPLKKKGQNYWACCPFHGENTASFSVSEPKQFYHCFGCGEHGNAIHFLREYENLDFLEAVENLAQRAGLEVPQTQGGFGQSSPEQKSKKKKILELLNQSAEAYCQQLRQHSPAIEYLKQRGLTGEIAKKYAIGYAPEQWHFIQEQVASDASSEILEESGMCKRGQKNNLYDTFRDRIMFPIRDLKGDVLAFGGRIINKGDQAKYMNSPETMVFHKSKTLYGLHEIIKNKIDTSTIIVVEGYMDVVALAQCGVPNAVATLGTATTTEHVKSLFRHADTLYFCFDGDKAGKAAAWKALENTLPVMTGEKEIRFAFLPEGEDPDSFIRQQGKVGFIQYLKDALPMSRFMLSHEAQGIDVTTIDGRARFLTQLMPHIEKLPEGFFKDGLLEQIANETLVNSHEIRKWASGTKPATRSSGAESKTAHKTPMRTAIAMMVQHPQIIAGHVLNRPFPAIDSAGHDLLKDLWCQLQKNPLMNTGRLLEIYRSTPHYKVLGQLATWDLLFESEQGIADEWQHSVTSLMQATQRHKIEKLSRKSPSQLTDEEKEWLVTQLLNRQTQTGKQDDDE